MTTYTTPYCAIHGYDFSSIVYSEGVDPSGGELGVEETQVAGRNYADVSSKGRAAKKYKIKARSTDRDEIETFLKEVNTAPEDAEFYPFSTFYPFDATRFGLIASAFASLKPPKITGAGKVFYEADAEIVCREAWLYGPDQGMAYAEDVALNAVSSLLTNEGHERAPISYLQASGDYYDADPQDVCRAIFSSAIAYIIDSYKYHTWYLPSSGGQAVPFGTIKMSRIAVSTDAIYAIGKLNGYIYRWQGIDWVLYNSEIVATDISVATDGTMGVISGGVAFIWSGGVWVSCGGAGITSITVLCFGYIFVIANMNVWRYDGAWTQISTSNNATDIDALSGTGIVAIFGGISYNLIEPSTWVSFGGADGVFIALRAESEENWGVVITTSNGNVWRYISTGGWTELTGIVPAYVEGLSCRITPDTSSAEHDREMMLCDKLLRDDIFEVGWRQKEVRHSWETAFSKLWAETAIDVHGKTSGGSITDHVLTLDNSDYLMIPFHGPLPISGGRGSACLELQVSAISGGSATAQVALLTDLEDMVEVDHDDLVVGLNTIYVPDLEGVGHVAIGIKAAASGAVSLSNFRGSVKRYVAPAQIPFADPDEDFKIRVEKTAGTQLAFLQVAYNDRFWY
jgi:hypothetical protein